MNASIPTQEEYAFALQILEELHPVMILEIRTAHVILLVGALQLALRHPAFPDYSREVLTTMINDIAKTIPSPVIRETIRVGFNPEFDQ
jgi:hypothetical protein